LRSLNLRTLASRPNSTRGFSVHLPDSRIHHPFSLLPFPLPLPRTPIRNPNTPHNLLRTIDTGTFCHQHCLTKKDRATHSPEHPSPASQLQKKSKKKVNSLLKRTQTRPKHLHQAPKNPQRLHRQLLRHPHVGQGIRKPHPESDPLVPEFEFAGCVLGEEDVDLVLDC